MEILSSQNHPHQQEEKKEEEEEEEMRGRYFHVLAVDDSRIERKILEQLLTVSSYQVTSVESGDKALEYLGLLDSSQQQGDGMKVNLIMTDYSMPGMTGYDLLKKVKGSSWKDVPVIVMSSENVPSRIHMCLEEGAEEFLLKPVRMSDLKKLQPYITRSLRHCYCRNNEGDDTKVQIHLIEGNTDNTKVEIRLIEESSDEKKVEIHLTEENVIDRLNLEEKSIEERDGDSDKQGETNKEIDTQPGRRSTNDNVSIEGLTV